MSNKIKSKKGIPSEYALFLDEKLGEKLEKEEMLSLEDLLSIIFPEKYQKRYHEIATKLVKILLDSKVMRSNKEIRKFIIEEKIFRETLYAKIIDKLERFGVIEKEQKEKVRGKPFSIKISNKFSDMTKKISEQWYMQYGIFKSKELKDKG